MAPLVALINPLSLLGTISATMKWAIVGSVGVLFLAGAATLWMRWRRRIAITALGQQRGLGEESAGFLGRLFAGVGMDAAETMLAAPELLRARLARELRKRRRVESAQEYAEKAARLLEELNTITQPFPDAPTPFMQLALQDAADPNSEIVTAWVLSVDERNISIISRHECAWPMRRELLATPPAGHGEPFRASLLLRPVPPRHEWVLTHDLVDVITNRRAAVRVSCCLETNVLPDSGDTVLLRERLADQETVPADDLRRLHGWAQRHKATVLDVSPDGCRVELEHDVALRDRFHVLFVAPDDRLAGMPLAEVVSLKRASAGRVTAGVRFIGMRLKERTRLAEFVRGLAGSATASATTAAMAATAATAARSATPAPASSLAATAESAESAEASTPASLSEMQPVADSEWVDQDASRVMDSPPVEESNDGESLADPSASEPLLKSSGSKPDRSRDERVDEDVSRSEAKPMWSWKKKGEDDSDKDEYDDEGAAPDAEERRRAMERLGIGPKRPAESEKPAAPAKDSMDDPFEYTPRFTSPLGPTKANRDPAAHEPEADQRTERPAEPVDYDWDSDERRSSGDDEGL